MGLVSVDRLAQCRRAWPIAENIFMESNRSMTILRIIAIALLALLPVPVLADDICATDAGRVGLS